MQTFVIDDQGTAGKCRRAQLAGREISLVRDGGSIYGLVVSIMTEPANEPKIWTVKIQPVPPPRVPPKPKSRRVYFRY